MTTDWAPTLTPAVVDETTHEATPADYSDTPPTVVDETTHEATPADYSDTPPTDDGLNHMGYFRRPAGEDQLPGSTIVIKTHATSDNLANVEREGVMEFLGYAPAS